MNRFLKARLIADGEDVCGEVQVYVLVLTTPAYSDSRWYGAHYIEGDRMRWDRVNCARQCRLAIRTLGEFPIKVTGLDQQMIHFEGIGTAPDIDRLPVT